MSDINRVYYVAAGRTLEKYEAILQQRRECNERRKAFREKVGAEGLILSDHDVVAATFKDNIPPKGWLKYKHHDNSFYPSRASKAGKAIDKEMRYALSWDSFGRLGEGHIEGRWLYHCTAEKLGEQIIVSQHKDAKPPEDAIPIKRSEYWALKEQQQNAQPELASTHA